MANKINISLIVPAFNEEKRLPKRFPQAFAFLKAHFKSFEIIFVNDGSTDRTEKVIQTLVSKYPNSTLISYQQNKGKGYAIKQAVNEAKGEIVGFTDADFAVDLEGVLEAYKSIKKGADIVIGDRNSTKSKVTNMPNFKRRLFGKALGLLNQFFLPLGDINDSQNGFKFFKKDLVKDVFSKITINRWLFDIQLLSIAKQRKYKIIQQPVFWQEIGESKVNILKDLPKISFDLAKLYFQFMTPNFLALLLVFLNLLVLFPFLINPNSLVLRNGDFSDLVWPNYYFIKETILNHNQIPLWNPTLFSGIPEIANPQSPIIYPPNVLALVLPIGLAIIILFIFHSLISGVFLYKLTREELKWSILSSLATVITFVFSPFFWTKIAVGHLSQIFAILLTAPILYFGYLLIKTGKWRFLFLTSIFLSFQYLNYPTIWYFTNLFCGIFLILSFIIRFQRKNFRIFIAPFLSLLLIFPIFLSQIQAGPLITRSILNINDLAIPIWSVTRFIKSIFIPSNFLLDNETEVWLYPSLAALILAGFGFWKLQKNIKLNVGFLLILIILITLGGRTPVFGFLTQYFPGFSYLRVSTRDWFVFILILSFLVGWAMEKLNGNLKKIFFALLIFDLIIFSTLRIRFIPNTMQPSSSINLQTLIQADSNYRTYCTNRCLSAKDTLPHSILTADGYHLLILQDYRLALSEAGGFNPPEYTGNLPTYSVADAQPSAEKLGKMAVKWVISNHQLNDYNFIKVKTEGGYTLHENILAKKRFYFQNNTQNVIEIKKDTPNQIILKTSGVLDTLVIADSFYPGWEAYIDDENVKIDKFDSWAKSIVTPEGSHIVKLDFKPFNIQQ